MAVVMIIWLVRLMLTLLRSHVHYLDLDSASLLGLEADPRAMARTPYTVSRTFHHRYDGIDDVTMIGIAMAEMIPHLASLRLSLYCLYKDGVHAHSHSHCRRPS